MAILSIWPGMVFEFRTADWCLLATHNSIPAIMCWIHSWIHVMCMRTTNGSKNYAGSISTCILNISDLAAWWIFRLPLYLDGM